MQVRSNSSLDIRPRKKKKKKKRHGNFDHNPYASLNARPTKLLASEVDASTIGGDHETDSLIYRVDSVQKFVNDDINAAAGVNGVVDDLDSKDYVA